MVSLSMSTLLFFEKGLPWRSSRYVLLIACPLFTFIVFWFVEPLYAQGRDEPPSKPTPIVAAVVPSQPPHYKSVCETQKVPDINGLSIHQARKAMFRDGWRPVRNTEPLWSDRELNFLKNGIHEVVVCSGTGMAQCYFEYQRGDYKVRLITFGEYDEVVGEIEAYCPELE